MFLRNRELITEDKKEKGHSEVILLYGLGLFFIYKILFKIFDKILAYANDPRKFSIMVLICLMLSAIGVIKLRKKITTLKKKNEDLRAISEKADDAVYCGVDDENKEVWIKPKQRGMHTQVIGTTNAGKTESVILPWAIQDIQQGRGLILIDGKADGSLLEKLWAYTVKAGREKDFRLFSLGNIDKSYQFNPLIGGTAEEITERVFNSFEFENQHYRSIQFEVMVQAMRIFEKNGITPTFKRLHQAISKTNVLISLAIKSKDQDLIDWAADFQKLEPKEKEQRTVGLLSAIGHFSHGHTSILFNADKSALTIDEALEKNLIVYFQLPVLLSPFLGKATGKLILQSLQSAVANRHRGSNNKKFFSVFLDDFSEYLYPGFVSILNKSRSANVGIVFAHQALGDIQTLGDPVANSILTNSNLKVFMRGNDPDSAEYFSKVIGTNTSTKFTERQKKGTFQTEKTGDLSAREVEEFTIHPNEFKRNLGVGEAIVLIPHNQGTKAVKLKFQMFDDLAVLPIGKIEKTGALNLSEEDFKDKSKPESKSVMDLTNKG